MYLCQFNLAWMKFPFDDPRFDSFKTWLNALHALAEKSPGFVRRHQGEKDRGGFIQPYPDTEPLVMGNFSVWADYESLRDYVFTDGHLEIMKSKRDWFHPPAGRPYSVMWWTKDHAGETLYTAKGRIEYLRSFGSGPLAFTFADPYDDPAIFDQYSLEELENMHKPGLTP